MHLQPNRNYVSNDDVQTPPALARRLVEHFRPHGRILEPCAGDGNFLRALRARASRVPAPITNNLYPITARASRASAPITNNSHPITARVARVPSVHWCEIKRGRDFFAWREPVDWIVTNPPWSEIRAFLQHAMSLADEIVMLFTVNHLWTRARMRDIASAGFGVREIVLLDMPRSFPPSGFQLGAVHLSRGWAGAVTLADWTSPGVPHPGAVAPVLHESAVGWSEDEIAAFRHWREERRSA
jgi:hypothetical protein